MTDVFATHIGEPPTTASPAVMDKTAALLTTAEPVKPTARAWQVFDQAVDWLFVALFVTAFVITFSQPLIDITLLDH